MIIRKLQNKTTPHHRVRGSCSGCGVDGYESEAILADAYNVWVWACECGAWNLLDFTKIGRGYNSATMHLTLPDANEVKANEWDYSGPLK